MADLRLDITVDTDTRPTRQEFATLRREIKREADAMGGDWEAAGAKIEDALREAGARDDLLDAARRIGREGPTEVEKMQRSLRDLDDTARDVAGDIKRAFGDNSLSGDDLLDANFRAEVQASARETGSEILGQISSALADGSIDAGTFATTLSEGLVEIGAEVGGPTGGALVAGGLIASALWGQVTAQQEAVQGAVSGMFDTILAEGAAAAEQARILENLRSLTEEQDKLNYSTELATTLNEDLSTILRARAGDETAMTETTAAHDEALASLREQYEAGTLAGSDYAKQSDAIRDALEDVTADFDTQRAGIDAAREATDAFTEATNANAAQQVAEAERLAFTTGKAQTLTTTLDGVSRTIRVMPDGKVIEVTDAGTAQLTQDEIDAIRGGTATVQVRPSFDQYAWQRAVTNTVNGLRVPAIVVHARLGQAAV